MIFILKRTILAIAISSTLIGCSSESPPDFLIDPSIKNKPDFHIDPIIQPVIDEYKAFADKFSLGEGESDKLQVAEIVDNLEPQNLLGQCFAFEGKKQKKPFGKGENFIAWLQIKITSKIDPGGLVFKIIVFHELTHCFFRINHIDDRFHIMNSSIFVDLDYSEYWDLLVAELAESIQNHESHL